MKNGNMGGVESSNVPEPAPTPVFGPLTEQDIGDSDSSKNDTGRDALKVDVQKVDIKIDEQNNKSNENEDDEEDKEFDQRNNAVKTRSWKLVLKQLFWAFAGVCFITAAITVAIVKPEAVQYNYEELWRFLLVIGLIIITPLLSDFILWLILKRIEKALRTKQNKKTRQKLTLAEFYIGYLFKHWSRLLWSLLDLLFVFLLKPVEGETSNFSEWFVKLMRLFYVFILLVFFFAISRLITHSTLLSLTSNFNSRGYATSSQESLVIEKAIRIASNPKVVLWGVLDTLLDEIEKRPLNDPKNASVRQQVIKYISEHLIDGTYTKDVILNDADKDAWTANPFALHLAHVVYSRLNSLVKEFPLQVEKDSSSELEDLGQKHPVLPRKRLDMKQVLHALNANPSILESITAETVWKRLDSLQRGYITKTYLASQFETYCLQRDNLKNAIADSRQVVKSLDVVVSAVVNFFLIIVFFVLAGQTGASSSGLWAAALGTIISFSFIFGDSVKNAFNSVVFIFFMLPFDVGDIIQVGTDATRYRVERITLLTTQLRRWDGKHSF
mmetsp:Transcript_27212/g.33144  ORF Transcript_27212/g.33144 Transcript_27212/m.33144 type:complete len:555 (-) Transcript_27212:1011-2675(-)